MKKFKKKPRLLFKKGIYTICIPFMGDKSPQEAMQEIREKYIIRKSAYLEVKYSERHFSQVLVNKF